MESLFGVSLFVCSTLFQLSKKLSSYQSFKEETTMFLSLKKKRLTFYCDICDVMCASKRHMKRHCETDVHLKQSKRRLKAIHTDSPKVNKGFEWFCK